MVMLLLACGRKMGEGKKYEEGYESFPIMIE